jgi:rhodanese-related sulfurtransferase
MAIMKKSVLYVPCACLLQSLIFFAICVAVPEKTSSAQGISHFTAPRKISHPEVPRIPAKELAQMIRKKANIVIVDTQPADGYQMWHIPSAVNIAFDALGDPMDRQLRLMELPADKPIVIYCLCEEGTDSAKMALELWQLGYRKENIKVLEDGLVLWDENGYPMVKHKAAN